LHESGGVGLPSIKISSPKRAGRKSRKVVRKEQNRQNQSYG